MDQIYILNWYDLKWLLGNLIETDGLNWIKLEIENLGLIEWIVKCKELNEYPMTSNVWFWNVMIFKV